MSDQIAFSESDALRILAYLTASADTQLFEPDIYGPFRMIEAASQLAAAVLAADPGENREFWEQMRPTSKTTSSASSGTSRAFASSSRTRRERSPKSSPAATRQGRRHEWRERRLRGDP